MTHLTASGFSRHAFSLKVVFVYIHCKSNDDNNTMSHIKLDIDEYGGLIVQEVNLLSLKTREIEERHQKNMLEIQRLCSMKIDDDEEMHAENIELLTHRQQDIERNMKIQKVINRFFLLKHEETIGYELIRLMAQHVKKMISIQEENIKKIKQIMISSQ